MILIQAMQMLTVHLHIIGYDQTQWQFTTSQQIPNGQSAIRKSTILAKARIGSTKTADLLSGLPYEILLHIFRFSGDERAITSVILSSRALYSTFNEDEHLYYTLCARHLSRSILTARSHFSPCRTFKSLYTELLYPYGPLLGLWASDLPFLGNILEFRIVKYQEVGWEGIVGEVWVFPEKRPDLCLRPYGYVDVDYATRKQNWERGLPCQIRYRTSVKIQLVPLSSTTSHRIANISFSWLADGQDRENTETENHLSLRILPPTFQSLYVNDKPSGPKCSSNLWDTFSTLHPEFPLIGHEYSPWFDSSRPMPRIKGVDLPLYDNSSSARTKHQATIFGAPSKSNTLKPSALAVYPSNDHSSCLDTLHNLPLNRLLGLQHLDDCRRFERHIARTSDRRTRAQTRLDSPPARYYPLRSPRYADIDLSQENTGSRWKPQAIVGLWIGQRHICGEFLVSYLIYTPEHKEIRAFVVSGIRDIPRGVIEWKFKVDDDERVGIMSEETRGILEKIGELSMENIVGVYEGSGVDRIPGKPFETVVRHMSVVLVNVNEIRMVFCGGVSC
ncbi:hypothetical protein ABKN59_003958 [Abortiporus biennis]